MSSSKREQSLVSQNAGQFATTRWSMAGQPVRLRFVMKDADLYSLRFRDPANTTDRKQAP